MTSQVNQYSGSASLQYFSVDPPAVGGANTPVVAGGAPSSASAAAEAGLTPEALMAYCAAALNGLDSQMEDIFNTQQKDNKLVTDINAAAGTFSQYQNGINYSGNAQSTSVPGSATDPSTPFGALTTPERLVLLERCERVRRRLPAVEHPLINQVARQATAQPRRPDGQLPR